MDYKTVRETIDKVVSAINKGNYTVEYESPNCVEECTALDGHTFYKGIDLDSPKTSNDFGYCQVTVEGYTFACDLNNGDYESDFFDQIDNMYEVNGEIINKQELIEEITDLLDEKDGIYFHMLDDFDEIMQVYALANNIENPEYYYWDDDDCPIDEDDDYESITKPCELDYGEVTFNKHTYYLVEDPNYEDDEQLHAVDSEEKPSNDGQYSTVLLTLKYKKNGDMKVTSCDECDDVYDAVEYEII